MRHSGKCPQILENAFHIPEERHLELASLCNPIFDDGLHTFYRIPINMHVHGMDIRQHTVCQLIHGNGYQATKFMATI